MFLLTSKFQASSVGRERCTAASGLVEIAPAPSSAPHNPTTNARIDAGVLRSVRMILTLGGAVARGVMRLHHASRIDLCGLPGGPGRFPWSRPLV